MADAVILAPASSTRNIIQPTADIVPLTIKRFSSGAVGDLFRVEDQAGVGLTWINYGGEIVRSGAAGTPRSIYFQTGASIRWQFIGANTGTESGSNAGSDLVLSRYSDAGSYVNDAIIILRNTGQTVQRYADASTASVVDSFIVQHQTSGIPATGFGIAIRFDGHSSNNTNREMGRIRYHWITATDASRASMAILSVYAGATEKDLLQLDSTVPAVWVRGGAFIIVDGAAGTARELRYGTGGSGRWAFGANGTAESGSDAGSDLVLTRFGDGGTPTTVFTVTRSSGDLTLAEGVDIAVGTSTGTKIGTATNQKLAFYNSTPIVQPATTGTATGFTAGSGTAVNDSSTFTGGTGATAYRISDIVKALKNLGLMAA
jgi:hypothetical protein